MNQEPRGFYIPPSALSLACLAVLTASTVLAQEQTVPAGQSSSKSSNKTHVATLRSSDSSEGSRVAITSDQSLNNYEAYRRGDRFYVKIPAADVARAESTRGRGFADIKSQRSGDSTVLSFRLEPGASAHVEQRGNKLDVVVSVPGGVPAPAANRPSDMSQPATSESGRGGDATKRGNAKSNNSSATGKEGGYTPGGLAANSATRNENESSTQGNTASPPVNSNSPVTPSANATPDTALESQSSAGAETTSPAAGPPSSTNGSVTPSPAPPPTPRADFWTRVKERGYYWLLLGQLNPVPVALGAVLLVFIIMLLAFQRRRATSTRRIKTFTKSTSPGLAAAADSPGSNATKTAVRAKTATVVAVKASRGAESLAVGSPVQPATRTPAARTVVSSAEDGRRERLNRAGEEAKKILAGDRYDESYVGSEDPETRRLLAAELLSALVSRNAVRRERARAAFMKYRYFDDATRDLRIADSENERAAAARRLSFVNDREATPHLIGALTDPSPHVRRAAVEALMDLRDPAAIGPLNALLQNERDRKVPRHLIQNAIETCASVPAHAKTAEPAFSPAHVPPPAADNPDREVIEI